MKMKLLYILILAISFSVTKADVSSSMLKASEYYKKNQYQEAIQVYNKLIDQGFIGTSLYYNLGNAYYRLGKFGYAIMYYEKALSLSPGDEDVISNLQVARQNLKDKVDSLPPFFIFNIWEDMLAAFTVTGWTIITYIFFILFLISITAYFFSRSALQQRTTFFTGATFLFVLALTIGILVVKIHKEISVKYGIVLEPSVTVKSSPDQTSNDEFVIHEGLKIKLEDRVDNWVKIRLDDGKVGWVENKNTGEI